MLAILIAVRNLFGEKGRFLITAGGVAFSVMLILVLVGLYQGWSKQMTRFLGNIEADIWIGQKGTRDMSHTVSLLSTDLEEKIEKTENVNNAAPFIGRQVSFEINGKEAHLFLVGVNNDNNIEPYKIIEGKKKPNSGEIIIDTTFAKDKKLSLNDVLSINNAEFKIIGIGSGGNLLVYSYAMVNLQDLRKILNFNQFNNYYLVKSDNPSLAKINLKDNFPDLEIIERKQFLNNNAALLEETFLPIIGVLVIISVAIGTAVIGLTIFTATIEKNREYGVLKAIGYTSTQLFSIVVIQSLVAGLVGFIVGNILVNLVSKVAEKSVSGFLYEVGGQEIFIVLLSTLIMSIFASLIPLKRLLSIDPAQVFKA